MVKTRVTSQDTLPGTDTEMSKLCDRYLNARDKVEEVWASFQAVEKELIQAMRSAGKKSIKHGGVTIRQVHQEEKDKIQVVSAE